MKVNGEKTGHQQPQEASTSIEILPALFVDPIYPEVYRHGYQENSAGCQLPCTEETAEKG